jgi:hypothetical protein
LRRRTWGTSAEGVGRRGPHRFWLPAPPSSLCVSVVQLPSFVPFVTGVYPEPVEGFTLSLSKGGEIPSLLLSSVF